MQSGAPLLACLLSASGRRRTRCKRTFASAKTTQQPIRTLCKYPHLAALSNHRPRNQDGCKQTLAEAGVASLCAAILLSAYKCPISANNQYLNNVRPPRSSGTHLNALGSCFQTTLIKTALDNWCQFHQLVCTLSYLHGHNNSSSSATNNNDNHRLVMTMILRIKKPTSELIQ